MRPCLNTGRSWPPLMTREKLRDLRDRLIAQDIAIRTELRQSRDKWRVAEKITLIATILIFLKRAVWQRFHWETLAPDS